MCWCYWDTLVTHEYILFHQPSENEVWRPQKRWICQKGRCTAARVKGINYVMTQTCQTAQRLAARMIRTWTDHKKTYMFQLRKQVNYGTLHLSLKTYVWRKSVAKQTIIHYSRNNSQHCEVVQLSYNFSTQSLFQLWNFLLQMSVDQSDYRPWDHYWLLVAKRYKYRPSLLLSLLSFS